MDLLLGRYLVGGYLENRILNPARDVYKNGIPLQNATLLIPLALLALPCEPSVNTIPLLGMRPWAEGHMHEAEG